MKSSSRAKSRDWTAKFSPSISSSSSAKDCWAFVSTQSTPQSSSRRSALWQLWIASRRPSISLFLVSSERRRSNALSSSLRIWAVATRSCFKSTAWPGSGHAKIFLKTPRGLRRGTRMQNAAKIRSSHSQQTLYDTSWNKELTHWSCNNYGCSLVAEWHVQLWIAGPQCCVRWMLCVCSMCKLPCAQLNQKTCLGSSKGFVEFSQLFCFDCCLKLPRQGFQLLLSLLCSFQITLWQAQALALFDNSGQHLQISGICGKSQPCYQLLELTLSNIRFFQAFGRPAIGLTSHNCIAQCSNVSSLDAAMQIVLQFLYGFAGCKSFLEPILRKQNQAFVNYLIHDFQIAKACSCTCIGEDAAFQLIEGEAWEPSPLNRCDNGLPPRRPQHWVLHVLHCQPHALASKGLACGKTSPNSFRWQNGSCLQGCIQALETNSQPQLALKKHKALFLRRKHLTLIIKNTSKDPR